MILFFLFSSIFLNKKYEWIKEKGQYKSYHFCDSSLVLPGRYIYLATMPASQTLIPIQSYGYGVSVYLTTYQFIVYWGLRIFKREYILYKAEEMQDG